METTFTINGIEFRIGEYDDGFRWTTDDDQGEAFLEPLLAQQDAMRHVAEKEAEAREEAEGEAEDARYGTESRRLYEDGHHAVRP